MKISSIQLPKYLVAVIFSAVLQPIFAANLPTGCGSDLATPPGQVGVGAVPPDPKLLFAKATNLYAVTEMPESDRKKDLKKGIAAYYLTPQQREGRRFVVIAGLTYYADGRLLLQTANTFKNTMNYVMDAAGNFYLFDEFTCEMVRHGNIFAGEPVAGAGNIKIENAHIVYINSDSGHYPGSAGLHHQVLQELKRNGSEPPDHPVK